MRIPKEEYISSIRSGLEDIQKFIRHRYDQGESSITFIIELYLQELLNVVFDTNLKNLNFLRKNYPSIDLADTRKGIGWQITITNDRVISKEKIRKTLKSFYDNSEKVPFIELKKISKIHLFIATGIPAGLKQSDIPKEIDSVSGKKKIENILFNVDNLWDFTRLTEEIIKIEDTLKLGRIEKIVNGIKDRPTQTAYNFDATNFISRVVDSIDNEGYHSTTADIFSEGDRNIALLANAGEGKSTYINSIANKYAEDPKFFCIKVKLIRYTSSLENLLSTECPNWQNYYKGLKLIIILDGLDEVEGSKFNQVFNEIANFNSPKSEVQVITTCRTNFFPLNIHDRQDDTFSITPYFLKTISEEDRKKYIQKKVGSKSEDFLSRIKKSNFATLIKTPFYLNEIIEIFQERNDFPQTRIQLLEELIEKRFAFEEKKPVTIKRSIENNRASILLHLKRIALLMQYAHKSKIDEIKLQEIVTNPEILDLLKRLFLEPVTDDCKTWHFKHLNFQEYFAAKALAGLEWKKLSKILFISKFKKLRQRWLNVVAFYFSIAEPTSKKVNKLLEELVDNDKESLVKIESDKIPLEIKTKVCIWIFEEHQKTKTHIWGQGFTVEDLGRFAEIDNNTELVSYLLTYLEHHELSRETRLDAVDLINQLKNPGDYRQRIIQTYLKLYRTVYDQPLGNIIIGAFSKWKLYDNEILKELVFGAYDLNKIKNHDILFTYISESDFSKLSASYLLKVLNAVFESEYLTGTDSMIQLLKLINQDNTLSEFIHLLIKQEEDRKKKIYHYRRVGLWEKVFEAVTERFQVLMPAREESLYDYSKFIDFIGDKLDNYQDDITVLNRAKVFLLTCSDKEKLIKLDFLENEEKKIHERNWFIAAILYEAEHNDLLIKLLGEGLISTDTIILFQRSLSKIQKTEQERLKPVLVYAFGENLSQIPSDPWKDHDREVLNLSLKAYLKKDKFISIIKTGLDEFNDPVEYEDLFGNRFYKEGPPSVKVEITLDFLRGQLNANDSVSKGEIIKWFENESFWEWLLKKNYIEIINHRELPPANLRWIKNWCIKNENRINFESPIDYTEGGCTVNELFLFFVTLSYFSNTPPSHWNCAKLIKHLGFLKSIRPRNKEDLSFTNWIKNILGETVFNQEVVNLIKSGDVSRIFNLDELLHIIDKNELRQTKNDLKKYIICDKISSHSRNRAFHLYVKFEGEYNDELKNYLSLIKESHDIDWSLFEYIASYDPGYASDWLLGNMKNLKMDVNRVSVQLLPLKPEVAMKIFISELKDKKRPLSDRFHENGNFLDSIKVEYFEADYLLSSMMELLDISLSDEFESSKYNSPISDIFNVLFLLFQATHKKRIIKEVEAKISILSEDNSHYNKTELKNFHYSYRNFKLKCFIEMDKTITLEKAERKIKKICPELFSN
ncbi:SMEK domain-containing protein [Marinilabilia salmonicolor]|uniref:SMEK domain-containing protein n=1 Tax=Marinilabilia salmonicolor TaxID=989 RepID=UPI00029A2ADF|nr:SMEK domain-containing protein [Marinilabilia salmonicolor]